MSDLAPFVAAALRDRVVLELQEEVRDLQRQLEELKTQTQSVSITGSRGHPVYASANFRQDGNYDVCRPELWKVEFPQKRNEQEKDDKEGQQQQQQQQQDQNEPQCGCSLADLADLQIRIGGICKARMLGAVVEGFVNDVRNNYNAVQKSGTVSIWFGGSSGIWLTIRIQPMERDQYASLRDFDLGGGDLVTTLLHFFHDNQDEIRVYFSEVSFLVSYMNDAMEKWGLLGPPPNDGNDNPNNQEEGGNDSNLLRDNGSDHSAEMRVEV